MPLVLTGTFQSITDSLFYVYVWFWIADFGEQVDIIRSDVRIKRKRTDQFVCN